MKKSCLVLSLLLCCALVLGVAGSSAKATTTSTTAAPSTWTNLHPAGSLPSARSGVPMVYDSTSGKVILFGGFFQVQNDRTYFNDTWAYDPTANTWTILNPAGSLPSARSGVPMVYDSASGKVILFGGFDGDADLSDTWAYDPTANAWTNLSPDGSLPSARAAQPMVYDSSSGKVILFGGFDGTTYLDDTWAYDPGANTWTEMSPAGDLPSARYMQSMVYDVGTGKMILFGGGDGVNDLNDTWAYDPSANTWTNLSPAGSLPSARSGQSTVYDLGTGKMILFGGSFGVRDDRVCFNDTWAYDPAANTWTNLSPDGSLPSARAGESMVYDSTSGKVILFGGTDGIAFFNDTWAFFSDTWATATPSAGPGFIPSVPLPTQISKDPEVIGTNFVLALVFAAIFGFTSTLFNNTLKTKNVEIVDTLGPVTRRLKAVGKRATLLLGKLDSRVRAVIRQPAALQRLASRLPHVSRRWLERVAIVLIAGLIYAFLDPGFGFSGHGLMIFVSLAVSVAAVTYAYEGVQALASSRGYHVPARLKLFPAAIGIAILCVLLSRITGFRPGYLYGFVGGLAFLGAGEPDDRKKGRLVLLAAGCLLVVSLAAWFLAIPLTNAVDAGSSWLKVIQGICVATFVAGLEGLLFGLVPLSFMDGGALFRWNKWVWGGVFGVAVFLFWHVLLNKNSKYGAAFAETSAKVVVGLLVFWTLVTVSTYLYFRKPWRKAAAEPVMVPAAEPSPDALSQETGRISPDRDAKARDTASEDSGGRAVDSKRESTEPGA